MVKHGWKAGDAAAAAAATRVKIEKDIIISCERETVRLLLRAGILKKDDLERGSAMICAGRGYPRERWNGMRQAEKRARAEQRGNAARIVNVCVRVYAREHKRRRGRG